MRKKTSLVPNEYLKRERKSRCWSQAYVARQIGTTAFNVSRWECGATTPGLHYSRELCRLFEKNLQELGLAEEERVPPEKRESQPGLASSETWLYDSSVPLPCTAIEQLVGRQELITRLKQQFTTCSTSALSGLPGVGKSTIALNLLHDKELQQQFQHGFLWAGLGCRPQKEGHLRRWGELLGASPDEGDNAAAWARSIHAAIGERRMLIVIDDVWSVEDALALKVGGVNCVHLITTRRPEIAIAFAGNHVVTVPELNEQDSELVFAQLAPHAIASAPREIRHLVQAVGGLPLALVLIGKYLQVQAHSGQPRRLQAAFERLYCAEERLHLTNPYAHVECTSSLPENAPLSLQEVIHVSCQQLPVAGNEALSALSLFPAKPNTFSEESALAVGAVEPAVLDMLTDAGLLEGCGPGRYTIHQTIVDYARLTLPPRIQLAAGQRMMEYFLALIAKHSTDYNLLELELNNILAALDQAEEQHLSEYLTQGINALVPFLKARGLYQLAEQYLYRGKEAAAKPGHEQSTATTLLHLGWFAELQGRFAQAELLYQEGLEVARRISHYELMSAFFAHWGEVILNQGDYTRAEVYLCEGLSLAQRVKDRQRCSIILKNLGEIADSHGEYERAEAYYREALVLAREIEDRESVCALLQNLGVRAVRCGNAPQATLFLEEGLLLARELGHHQRISALLMNIGLLAMKQGQYIRAEALYQESLELARHLSHRLRISSVLQNLGALERERDNYEQSGEYLSESLNVAQCIGHRWLISETLYEKGELYLKQQKIDDAQEAFQQALELARAMDARELIAHALYGLARIAALQQHASVMHTLGEESLAIFREIGHERWQQVANWLGEKKDAPC